jgi:uncharacterized protein (TIGR02271 family)
MNRDEHRHDVGLVRHEEELGVETRERRIGSVRVSKTVDTQTFERSVPREVEDVDVERVPPAGDGDSGQIETLPDGSVSIPVFEEEVVVTKRLVVRERVIVRKRSFTEQHRIEEELRKEHVDIDHEEEQ